MKLLFILLFLVSCGKATTTKTVEVPIYVSDAEERVAELEQTLEQRTDELRAAQEELENVKLENDGEVETLEFIISGLEDRIEELLKEIEKLKKDKEKKNV